MTAEEELLVLEQRLASREGIGELGELLSEDFVEIGSSGAVYDKAQALAAMQGAPPSELPIADFGVRLVAPDVALAAYCAGGSLRSSVWVRGDGGWRILFHQGTPLRSR